MKKRLTLSLVVVVLAVVGSLVGAGSVSAIAQERESLRSDLSGRWQLNRELSENAQAKLERMQSAQGSGHGPKWCIRQVCCRFAAFPFRRCRWR